MLHIDTDVRERAVEIEGNEYPVAAKTVEIAEQLLAAQKRCKGEPEYKLWLAELEILLGRDAARELFTGGRAENIDRLQRIHSGVLRAFDSNAQELQDEESDRQRAKLALATELLRQLNAIVKAEGNGNKPVIRRP